MSMSLKGMAAVIVGAGRTNGVGAATALLLAQEGCNVLINCRKNKLQATQIVNKCKDFGVEAELFMGDVTQSSICNSMAEYIEEKWGKVNYLVNCIGTTKVVPYNDINGLTEEDFAKIFLTNVTAPFLVIQAFQTLLSNSLNSSVINISSSAGINGMGSSIAYAASKGALNTMTLALAKALAPKVRVNAVCPGFIDSSWWEENIGNDTEKYKVLVQDVKENSLLNQVIKPTDVANLIVNILKTPGMTGELIRLNAGAHIPKSDVLDKDN